jgi:hypothetical protein
VGFNFAVKIWEVDGLGWVCGSCVAEKWTTNAKENGYRKGFSGGVCDALSQSMALGT